MPALQNLPLPDNPEKQPADPRSSYGSPGSATARPGSFSGKIPDDVVVPLLILAIFGIAVIAFWPLIPVFLWAIAVAVVLMPAHKRVSRIATPALSATFITVWVLLIVLLISSLAAGVMIENQEHIAEMGVAMVTGLQHTIFAGFVPALSGQQLADFSGTLKALVVRSVLSLSGNTLQTLLSVIIFFLSVSMLLYYGESIRRTATGALSPGLRSVVNRLSEIAGNTIYSLIIVQISAAILAFILAIPFFFLLGRGDVILFSILIGAAMLIPLIGAQLMILLLALYFFSIGDTGGAVIMLVAGYPLLSGWIDFYYRPAIMGRRVAVHPVLMMIGIFAGVPFMGITGFILGPVLIALVVTGARILSQEYLGSGPAGS